MEAAWVGDTPGLAAATNVEAALGPVMTATQEGVAVRARSDTRFSRVWTAAAVSFLGDGLVLSAFPLLAATMTRSAVLIAGVQAARFVPRAVLGLIGGAWADRYDRRRIMVTVDTLRAIAVLVLVASLVTGSASIVILYVVAALLGTGEAFFDPAAMAILPQIVDSDRLERATGRMFAAESLGLELVGPAVGGLLFAWSPTAPVLGDAVSFAVAAALIANLRDRYRTDRAPGVTTIRADMREGLRYLIADSPLVRLAVLTAGFQLTAVATEATLVIYATRHLGLPASRFGLLLAVAAAGGLAGGFSADRLVGWVGTSRIVWATYLITAAGAILAATTTDPRTAAAGLAIAFGASAIGNVATIAARHRHIPDHLRGRINATYRTILFTAAPIGALTGGALATINPRLPMLLLAIASAAVATPSAHAVAAMQHDTNG